MRKLYSLYAQFKEFIMDNNYEPIIDANTKPVGNDKLFAILRKNKFNLIEFDFVNKNAKTILNENGIDYGDGLILRRTLSRDGKSKAWVNDIPMNWLRFTDNLKAIHY